MGRSQKVKTRRREMTRRGRNQRAASPRREVKVARKKEKVERVANARERNLRETNLRETNPRERNLRERSLSERNPREYTKTRAKVQTCQDKIGALSGGGHMLISHIKQNYKYLISILSVFHISCMWPYQIPYHKIWLLPLLRKTCKGWPM